MNQTKKMSFNGLNQHEVDDLIKQYGYNEIPEKRRRPVLRLLSKFWGLSAWMLELIIILSFILHNQTDAYIVLGLLIFNAIIGFSQEYNATNAVRALRKKLQVRVKVLRDGNWQILAAQQIVPGDIVRIRTGDFVPADIKIIQGEIYVDQSALTGESLEVRKDRDVTVYSGSIITKGEATAIILATGINTFYGKTIDLVKITKPKSHVDELISKIVRWLFAIIVSLLGTALVISIMKGINLMEILPLMLVLLLGAIPVALSAMITVSMALGAKQLVKEGVLITHLNASDDAASMDILCVDKTGTLTKNQLSIAGIISDTDFTEKEVLLYGTLASQEADHDPIDIAFLNDTKQQNIDYSNYTQQTFFPFDPNTRKTIATVQHGKEIFQVIKGSFDAIVQDCNLNEKTQKYWETEVNRFAANGYRVIAVAKTDGNAKPLLVGLAALNDPPRPDSATLIQELEALGISVKMLTGDAVPVAREIAKMAGLKGKVLSASELKNADEAKVDKLLQSYDGIAEIYPADKYQIVKSYQANGHIVGMTGDGVNDAPALRIADVGIAVSNATDVAKEAASMVLTKDGLTPIIYPIKIGRMMFERINIWIINKIASTILKTCFVVFSFFITGKYLISASAMLLILFMTDFVKISLSTDNVKWSQHPVRWQLNKLVQLGVIIGILITLEAFGLLYIGLRYFSLDTSNSALNTFCFDILLFFALFSIFVVREKRNFWYSRPSNTLMFMIIADMVLGFIISTYGLLGLKAIPVSLTLCVFFYTLIFSLLNDYIKVIFLKKTHILNNI